MGEIGLGEVLVLLLVGLLLFGPSRLAELGKGIGAGVKNFKKGLEDDEEETKAAPPLEAPQVTVADITEADATVEMTEAHEEDAAAAPREAAATAEVVTVAGVAVTAEAAAAT